MTAHDALAHLREYHVTFDEDRKAVTITPTCPDYPTGDDMAHVITVMADLFEPVAHHPATRR
jgi:hypothetical protein